MSDFKPGDVVQLKSGGIKMTVGMNEGPGVWCEWHTTTGEPKDKRYPVRVLQLVEPPAAKPQKQPRRCECAHPLREHNAQGACLHRDEKTRAPCPGPCRIIEAGEE